MSKPDNFVNLHDTVKDAIELRKDFSDTEIPGILIAHSLRHVAGALYELGFNDATGITVGAVEGLTMAIKDSVSRLTETLKEKEE